VKPSVEGQRAFRLGKAQWLVLALSLSLTGLLAAWALLHPSYDAYDCEHRYLPSVEARFGFRGGRTSLPGRPYALLEIAPSGILGQAGFRAGDVPVFKHGGLADFCAAVRRAEKGHPTPVSVVNAQDYDYRRRRELRVPSLPGAGGR
jgi:hypothetical protein